MALVIAGIGVLALAAAFIAEHLFDLPPCQLCIYQRWPYGVNIILGLAAFATSSKCNKTTKVFLGLAIASFAVGAAIAGFHVGVEQGWWKMTSNGCDFGDIGKATSIDQLKNLLGSAVAKDCSKPAFTLFGISMAGFNFLGSTFLVFVLSCLTLKKACKNEKA